jgi:Tfp pilus assembly protein PilF
MRPKALLLFFLALAGAQACAHGDSRDPFAGSSDVFARQIERQNALAAAEKDSLPPEIEMSARGHEDLGDDYLRGGFPLKAYVQYTKALGFDEDNTRIRYKLGLVFLERRLSEEAYREFSLVLEKDPENALAVLGAGRARFIEGDYDESRKFFLRAIELDNGLWQAHAFLGIMNNRLKHHEDAVENFKTAILFRPRSGALFNNLGVSYMMMGDCESAVKAFAKAVESGDTDSRIHNNLAVCSARLGKMDKAFEAFRRGVGEARAYNNLGYLYYIRGEYAEAVEAFEKAVQKSPSYYVKAYENLKSARAALEAASRQKEAVP